MTLAALRTGLVKAAEQQGSTDRLLSVESDDGSTGTLGQAILAATVAARNWQQLGTTDTATLAATAGQSDASAARQPQ